LLKDAEAFFFQGGWRMRDLTVNELTCVSGGWRFDGDEPPEKIIVKGKKIDPDPFGTRPYTGMDWSNVIDTSMQVDEIGAGGGGGDGEENSRSNAEETTEEEGIDVKDGVDISKLSDEMVDTFDEVAAAFREHAPGVTPVITSTYEPVHTRREDSKHYEHNAFDLRTRDLTGDQQSSIVTALQLSFGSDYDVLDKGEHIHIEYDPD
jgi:hypothetical protein